MPIAVPPSPSRPASRLTSKSITARPSAPDPCSRLELLDLPDEILSQIASSLPLAELVPFLSLHPRLLLLTQSHLTPIAPSVRAALAAGPPYPPALAVLPHLAHVAPPAAAAPRAYLDILTRARPRWILERFEAGRWDDALWAEAFARRFLPSWQAYKRPGDSWRAAFLRVLGKLEHRYGGCTHDETATKFIALHRNGSGSLNRTYARHFNPYEIFDEIKKQNNNAGRGTHVRVVVHLADVRIIALGVRAPVPTVFANANAHKVLHPPLLREVAGGRAEIARAPVPNGLYKGKVKGDLMNASVAIAADATAPATSTRVQPAAASPLIYDTDATNPQASSPSSLRAPASPLRAMLTSVMPSFPAHARARRPSDVGDSQAVGSAHAGGSGARFTAGVSVGAGDYWPLPPPPSTAASSTSRQAVRPADEHRRRSWSLSRPRAGSSAGVTLPSLSRTMSAVDSAPPSSCAVAPAPVHSPRPRPATPVMPTVDEAAAMDGRGVALLDGKGRSSTPPAASAPRPATWRTPYRPLVHPTPAESHARYPNLTPAGVRRSREPSAVSAGRGLDRDIGYLDLIDAHGAPQLDRRALHAETHDDTPPQLFFSEPDAGSGGRWVEVDDDGSRHCWIGSMLLFAQLHPSDRARADPLGADLSSPVEGTGVDLGPPGMYASLDWEDLAALFPWIELHNDGAYSANPRRSGMGFE